jgi:shikimate dehydrogenase
MEYGCIAETLGHSFSKEIHALLGGYSYELCELKSEDLDSFLRNKDFKAINVTIPYKEAVLPYMEELDEQAREIGAVNTVVNRGGKLCGYNTDFYGMKEMIRQMGISLMKKKVAILGTGGTCRTARAVARDMGAGEILTVSRSQRSSSVTYEELCREHRDVQILINTTPCGMFPHTDTRAVNVEDFPSLEGVVDAVYNPVRTQLVLDTQKKGIPAMGGLYMLVAQAVRASEIFLDIRYPFGTTEKIFSSVRSEKENPVLIGMPGCGKTTVGNLLAKQKGRVLLDTDELIVQAAGLPIPEIFERYGEAYFRDLETHVIRNLVADRTGVVIATGGGVVLRKENVDALRRNGRLYFLDRAPKDLIPTEDRPLSSTIEAMELRYRERYAKYCSSADVRISVEGDPTWVAEKIGKDFENI